MLYRFSKTFFALAILLYAGFVVAYIAVSASTPAPTRGAWQATLAAAQPVEALMAQGDLAHVRVPVYWDEVSPERGTYDFSSVDSRLAELEAGGAQATLVLGYRQPGREHACSFPGWLSSPHDTLLFSQHLFQYLRASVVHYEEHSAVAAWQIEHEPFSEREGCPAPDAQLYAFERDLVAQIDPSRPVIAEPEPPLSQLMRHAQGLLLKLPE